MNLNSMNTSIHIKKTTKGRLQQHGTVADSFDSLLNSILDHLEKCDKYWEDKS